MGKLIDALRTEDATTLNGMTTNSTSLNHCVDFFFQAGAIRGKGADRVTSIFSKAYNEDPLTAMKLAFWVRDVRGGAGERQVFKDIVTYLASNHEESISKNLALISEFGRWDDILTLIGTSLEANALDIIATALKNGNQLIAKWLPRPNVKNRVKKNQARVIRKYLDLTPGDYRRLLSGLSNTVEQSMCAKEFSNIDYSKIPSKAMADYLKAFGKNDYDRFSAYITSLEKGETKVNASAVYPYDIIKSLNASGNHKLPNEQWKALPNYLEGNKELLLPVCDVSSSMSCSAGSNKNLSCMDVCISLGMYISERNLGPFKDAFLTFHESPSLEVLNGSLSDRYNQLRRAKWGGSTNLEATFKLVLDKAIANNVSQEDMPTMILILSDMEFNQAISGYRSGNWNPTAQKMIEKMYSDSGYKMPKIAFWNLNARSGNSPVAFDKEGTALVSGFSTSILKSLLSGKDMTPQSMMMDVVNSERYNSITV